MRRRLRVSLIGGGLDRFPNNPDLFEAVTITCPISLEASLSVGQGMARSAADFQHEKFFERLLVRFNQLERPLKPSDMVGFIPASGLGGSHALTFLALCELADRLDFKMNYQLFEKLSQWTNPNDTGYQDTVAIYHDRLLSFAPKNPRNLNVRFHSPKLLFDINRAFDFAILKAPFNRSWTWRRGKTAKDRLDLIEAVAISKRFGIDWLENGAIPPTDFITVVRALGRAKKSVDSITSSEVISFLSSPEIVAFREVGRGGGVSYLVVTGKGSELPALPPRYKLFEFTLEPEVSQ